MDASTAPSGAEDRLYHSLKRAILEQRLPPGTRLREQQLAELFGVKRGRVRTALTRLVQDRLVQHRPNAGAQVACPDAREARDLFATRRLLEGAVVEGLAGNLTDADVQALYRLLDEERQAYREQHLHEGLRLSVRFHVELARLGGNRVLQDFIEEILARTPLVLLGSHPTPRACVNHDHGEILEALRAGDGKRARHCMETHIDELEQQFTEQRNPPEPDLREVLNEQSEDGATT